MRNTVADNKVRLITSLTGAS